MPRRAGISKRFATAITVSQQLARAARKARRGSRETEMQLAAACPCSPQKGLSAEAAAGYVTRREACERSGDARRSCGWPWQSTKSGSRVSMPRMVGRCSKLNAITRKRIAPASASKRWDDQFICRSAGRRPASTAMRGASFIIRAASKHRYSMAGMIGVARDSIGAQVKFGRWL